MQYIKRITNKLDVRSGKDQRVLAYLWQRIEHYASLKLFAGTEGDLQPSWVYAETITLSARRLRRAYNDEVLLIHILLEVRITLLKNLQSLKLQCAQKASTSGVGGNMNVESNADFSTLD